MRRSACAAAYVCVVISVAPWGVLERLVTNVHQAFWLAVVETAVLGPISAITYLAERQQAPRALRLLAPAARFLWAEAACPGAALWAQLFVAHASLAGGSPAAPGDQPGIISTLGVLGQGVMYLCVVELVHDVTAVLGAFRAAVMLQAGRVLAAHDDDVDLEDAMFEGLMYSVLAGQGLLCGCAAHLLTAAALYLERASAGMFVTALCGGCAALSQVPLVGLWPGALSACEAFIFALAYLQMHAIYDEAAEERRRRAGEGPWDVEEDDEEGALWRPSVATAIPREILRRLAVRLVLGLEWGLRRFVSWKRGSAAAAAGVGWGWFLLSCPEAAALWAEDERRRFYAAALIEAPSSALAASWGNGPLRRRHVELWRWAGLTTDFVLGDKAAAGIPGSAATSGWVLFLGRCAAILVRGLEATFGVCLVGGGIVMAIMR